VPSSSLDLTEAEAFYDLRAVSPLGRPLTTGVCDSDRRQHLPTSAMLDSAVQIPMVDSSTAA